ncbi:hypothetical protein Pla123a_02860 [Posidoniimonas polymericola]|uniref:DUF3891 domain-containing protein n=1 Tax=Posidoniimonas polymericola TaxID=2528002 RepID=A0A5C5ZDI3_9BACT|nr:DUF3891 family protein [Posidoniimonas polymericola]TWT85479.1 hypothetical protein Pla123a_02860 [Posidoniimonas polymericola]
MIVSSVEEGWEIVFQRSHGLLAGQIASRFRDEFRPELWTETLQAILSHDDHKQPFDGRHYVTDLGAPKDFTLVSMASEDRVEETRRRILLSHRNHRWCGLLISRHAEQLYGGHEGITSEMQRLLEEERDRRRLVLRQLSKKKAQLELAYQLLRWCDRCSLILVRKQVPAMQRRIEVTHSLQGERHDLWRREDESLAVEPWPFEPDEFTVQSEYRVATRLQFEDDADLINHLDEAEVCAREWVFRRKN